MVLNEQGEFDQVYIDQLDAAFLNQKTLYDRYKAYTVGNNPAIFADEAKEEPDNRIPVPFARKIALTIKGYMAKVGYITYKSNGSFDDFLNAQIFKPNNEGLLTAELLNDAVSCGWGYELLIYLKEAAEGLALTQNDLKQYRIKPDRGLMIYSDNLAHEPLAFVHRTTREAIEGKKAVLYDVQTIYYAEKIVIYERASGSTNETDQANENPNAGNSSWQKTNDTGSHPFGAVPAIEYNPNLEHIPIYMPVIPMIDEHDKIISSDYANELERFANAYLLMLREINTIVDDDGLSDLDKIKQLRLFDKLGDGGIINNVSQAVGFLTKPSRGGDVAEAADRFERLIYEMSMVINPNDQSFATVSGIALKYKLLPMEWLSADIEAYFSLGLQRRIDLISNASKSMKRVTPEEITINFRRNIPVDIAALATEANSLKGILSDETILKLFPQDIVPDIQKELDRLAEALPDLTIEERGGIQQ